MRQRALIASALVTDPQLIIADEPTTALDPNTASRILDLFASVRARGTAVLLISHDLQSVAKIADRIAVLDHGQIVEMGEASQILHHPQHPITQRLLAAAPSGPKPGPPPKIGEPLLTVKDATRRFATAGGQTLGLDRVSVTLHRGEAVGILGESGAGKTTLARVLVGAERLDDGTVERAVTGGRTRLIPQDPLATFDPRWRVERIIATSNRLPGVSTAELLSMVGLQPALAHRRPSTLSGGQRQRVAIARAIAADPDVLVCDEPVSALDVATQAGILSLLRRLQQERELALVFVSHDLAALRTVSDRVLVMNEGRIVQQGATEDVFAELP
jgi:peptide/nickel transport system ATP-binding protein